MQWYLIIVSICNSIMIYEVECLFVSLVNAYVLNVGESRTLPQSRPVPLRFSVHRVRLPALKFTVALASRASSQQQVNWPKVLVE